ncbi:MAG: hypothetical protein ACKO4S_04345 [Snowella sp.]
MSQTPDPNSSPPKSLWGKRIERFLDNILEPIDLFGQRLLGDLWKTLYFSIQDAIALGLLLQIPSFIGKIIIGKDFSSFDVCLKENALGPSFYACFIIVGADVLLWISLAGRIIARFNRDFKNLWRK